MIAIRVDGNSQIGMGHISRCLSIASALKRRHADFCFICSNNTPIEQIEESGYSVHVIEKSLYDSWSMDDEICFIISNNISILLIDSYFARSFMLKKLHTITKIVYLDDLCLFDYDVDVILNYNIEANDELYKRTAHHLRKCYLGLSYFPLKESLQFTKKANINKEVNNVLITTGGTDPIQCLQKILLFLDIEKYEDITFSVILGLFYDEKYCSSLKEQYAGVNNLVFLNWGQDMKRLYGQSDIVIAPGSTTIYEALSVGVPCISFQFADNQHNECIALDKMGMVPYMGNFTDRIDRMRIKHIFNEELLYATREKQYSLFSELFDGKGSQRIAEIIVGVDNDVKV